MKSVVIRRVGLRCVGLKVPVATILPWVRERQHSRFYVWAVRSAVGWDLVGLERIIFVETLRADMRR